MKKIIYLLILGIILIIPNSVKGETISIPVPKFYIDTTDGTLSSDGVSASWWGTNNYYESYYHILRVISGVALTTGANVQLPNVNWCEGQQVHIVGKLAVLSNFFQTSSLSFWASNGGKGLTCSYKMLGGGDEMQFDCVGTGGKGFMIGFSINDYDINKSYSFGINRSIEVTCDASNLSVIENQNQNKNEIINNQNQNTQNIINNQNTNQRETNEKLNEVNETNKGIWGTIKDVLSSIIELPGKLVNLLIEGLKSLFIPSNMSFLYDFVETIENKLGFIAEIPMSIIEFTLNLASASWEDVTSVHFPSIETFGVRFWNDTEIDLTEGINMFKSFKYITDVIAVTLFCRFLLKTWESFTGGKS